MDQINQSHAHGGCGMASKTLTLRLNNVPQSTTPLAPRQVLTPSKERKLWGFYQECKAWFERNPNPYRLQMMKDAHSLWHFEYTTLRGIS